MACLLTTSIVFGDYAAIQVWCGDVTYIWTGKPGGGRVHTDWLLYTYDAAEELPV